MIAEGNSFVKGVMFGGLFCVVITLMGSTKMYGDLLTHQHHHLQVPNKEELLTLPETKRVELSKSIRVLCLVMVSPKEIGYWAAARDTWTKHCDGVVFYSSESVKIFPAINLETKDKWTMTRKALKHAYENYKVDFNWILLVDSPTFAIIENLKFFVLNKDPAQPFYIGHTVKSGDLQYVEFKAGIVLSIEALERFHGILDDPVKCPEQESILWKTSEDKGIADCLKYTGVFAENAEDAEGKELFNTKSVSTLVTEAMSNRPNEVVEGCCSDVAVTFHSDSPNHMHLMMYGVYRLRPYGHVFNDALIFTPPKDSNND